jgi:hypothetical protein
VIAHGRPKIREREIEGGNLAVRWQRAIEMTVDIDAGL